MTFRDNYPNDLEFEIDRVKLQKYLRVQGLIEYLSCGIFFGLLMSPIMSKELLELHIRPLTVILMVWILIYTLLGVLLGAVIGILLYFGFTHFSSIKRAQNLRLIVEGPYLRIVHGAIWVHDERIHFRDISDYSTLEGPLLRRFGLKTLKYRLNSRPQLRNQEIIGLVDANLVRDQLCDIDTAREQQDNSVLERRKDR